MNRVDGVILGVGIVVLVASIMGVIFYEDTGGTTYVIGWEEGSEENLDELTQTGGPETYEFEVPVNGTVLSQVNLEVEASISGSHVSEDSVTVTAEGPQGQSEECSFTIGVDEAGDSCTAEASINEEPQGFDVQASNQSAAEQQAREQVASDNGTGLWTVTVEIDGGQEVADPSYDVTLAPSLVEWSPVAQRPSDGGPGPG